MLGCGKVIDLQEMKARGMGIREITRETGHGQNTIRRCLRSANCPDRSTEPRGSKLEPLEEHVRATWRDTALQLSLVRQPNELLEGDDLH